MLTVAVLFDLLPLLAVLGAGGLMFSMVDSSGQDACAVSKALEGSAFAAGVKLGADVLCKGNTAVGVAAAGGVMFVVGPFLYVGISVFISIVTVLVYSFWFALHHVNMWAFRSKRLTTNLVAAIVENVPLLNLLPGTTFMVWRHIKISDMEDAARTQAAASQPAAVGRRALTRQRQQSATASSAAVAVRNAERRRRADNNDTAGRSPATGTGFERLRRVAAVSAAQEARVQNQTGRPGAGNHWNKIQALVQPRKNTPNQSARNVNTQTATPNRGTGVPATTRHRTPQAANDNAPIPLRAAA